jgi:hypothetical protein
MGWIAKTTSNEQLDQVKTEAEQAYHKHAGIPGYEEEKPIMPQPQRPLTYTRPQLRHTWQDGDTIATVALKYGADPEEILDYNLVEEHELTPGQELLISKRQVIRRAESIRYEPLDHPVTMHVNKQEGIQKYAFGNIRTADDVQGTGHFPLGTKLTIVGIAHVPTEDGEYLAYYMDDHAFGQFATTKKVSWNVGYAWTELTEGDYTPPPEEELTFLTEPDEPITIFDEEPEPEPESVAMRELPKDGEIKPLNSDHAPEKYLFEYDIELHEANDQRAPIKRHRLDPVWIIGTITVDGEEYYQPGKNIGEVLRTGLRWPIPMDAVLPEDEVFDYSIKRRGLTRQERWFEVLAMVGGAWTRYRQKHKE